MDIEPEETQTPTPSPSSDPLKDAEERMKAAEEETKRKAAGG